MSARRWLIAVLVVAGLLRLLAIWLSDTVPWDGVYRLGYAVEWAANPNWQGLSGIWPPLHWYVLGGLIRIWNQPRFWADLLGWLAGVGSVYVMFQAVRVATDNVRAAGFAALLLAIYWGHIWLAPSNYVETFYVYFVLLSACWVLRAERATQTRPAAAWAVAAGLAMAVALLLRHEAKIVTFVMLGYLLLSWRFRAASELKGARTRLSMIVAFAAITLPLMAYLLIESRIAPPPADQVAPINRGAAGGLVAQTERISRSKAWENQLDRRTPASLLARWIFIPAGTPSVVVVLLAAVELWRRRRGLHRELFLLLFASQAAFYLLMTLLFGWALQIRYSTIYFTMLLPYAGMFLASWTPRPKRPTALLTPAAARLDGLLRIFFVIVVIQAAAWSQGRNEGRPLGWLPIFVASPAQHRLNEWFKSADRDRRVLVLPALKEWEATISQQAAWKASRHHAIAYLSPQEQEQLRAGLPIDLSRFDYIVADPAYPAFAALWRQLPPAATQPDAISPHMVIIRLR